MNGRISKALRESLTGGNIRPAPAHRKLYRGAKRRWFKLPQRIRADYYANFCRVRLSRLRAEAALRQPPPKDT